MVDLEEIIGRAGAVHQRVVALDWEVLGGVELDRDLGGIEE